MKPGFIARPSGYRRRTASFDVDIVAGTTVPAAGAGGVARGAARSYRPVEVVVGLLQHAAHRLDVAVLKRTVPASVVLCAGDVWNSVTRIHS